ncbi:MAG: radical SAM family heme chaperone HemW [Flavobacteriaceae bacterium]|nr:radical SAM family heme chaperone HemW [Flavobacteriaceae bacterium]
MGAIYIHIPFCKQACYYCNFHFSTSLKRKSEMIQALAKELVIRKNELTKPIETIYFGGGTPSLLPIGDLKFLIDTIHQNYTVVDNPEITLEANPDDLNSEKIKCIANSPINRLSIGIQSFYDADLQFMNRAHTADEALNCLKEAVPYFDNITVDLIYGIPNLTSKKWCRNLQTIFDLGIKHLSSYALTVEPKTALASFIKSGKYPPVDDNLAREHFNILVEETKKNGFIQYEIANFGKEDYFSKHNTAYWQGKFYLGIGPSAHSFNGTTRSWNIANNALYLKAIGKNELSIETEALSKKDRFNETIMTGLRTMWGVDLNAIEKNFGIHFKTQLLEQSQKHIRQGLLEIVFATPSIRGKPARAETVRSGGQSLNKKMTSFASFNRQDDLKQQILKITPKGLFLADGIAADLFVV